MLNRTVRTVRRYNDVKLKLFVKNSDFKGFRIMLKFFPNKFTETFSEVLILPAAKVWNQNQVREEPGSDWTGLKAAGSKEGRLRVFGTSGLL